jgi:pimeloyl-ACP methyl ester carboxylesterase
MAVLEKREHWVTRDGVRLHVVEHHASLAPELTPLLHIPGAFQGADRFDFWHHLAPRRVVVYAQRGRGKSDAPTSGYTWEDHVADVEAVTAAMGLDSLFLYSFSQGTAAALGFALRHPERIKGLIIGDFPALYPKYDDAWKAKFAGHANPTALDGIVRESREISMWAELPTLTCPVLLLHGDQAGIVLRPEDIANYKHYLPHIQIKVFEGSSHPLWEPSEERLTSTLRDFMASVEK